MLRRSVALIGCLALAACATYQSKVAGARDLIRSGSYDEALKVLEPLAKSEGRDQLVYLLDYATVLQQAGKFGESAKSFGVAEKIADIQDYHSLTNVTSSLLLSEEMIQYKGDDYEKVLINAINSVNYLEMGNLEEALVEVRRMNNKLYKFKFEAKRDYEQNPYAFYLSALIYEADGKWDDAYISYKNAYEVAPNFRPLREDLIRAAIRAQRGDDLERWRKAFPEVKIRPEWSDRNYGEIVLVLMQGWGPRKYPRPDSPRFPYLVPVPSVNVAARLSVQGGESVDSETIFSVEEVAIKTLNDDYSRLLASRVAGVGVKAVVADQLKQKNQLLGELAWIALNIADQADLRQWSTLPQTFQFARLPIKSGKFKINLTALANHATVRSVAAESQVERKVDVKRGGKTFVVWRMLN